MKTFASSVFMFRNIENLDWVIYILIFCMILAMVGRLLFSNNFEALGSVERFVDVNDNQFLFGISVQLLFSVLLATLILPYATKDYDFIFSQPLIKVIGITTLFLVFFMLRSFFVSIGTYAFKIPYDYNVNFKSSNYFLAYTVAFLWLADLVYYFSEIPKTYIFLVSIMVVVLIRVLYFVNRYQNEKEDQGKILYYNILYLCTLEILPLLVLFKFLTVW